MTYAEAYEKAYRSLGGPASHFTEKSITRLKEHMKFIFPTDLEVRFRRVVIKEGQMGDCSLVVPKTGKPAYFLIRIDKRLPLSTQWVVLIHEYAHALQWRPPIQEAGRLADHDAEWGIAEGRIWDEVGG